MLGGEAIPTRCRTVPHAIAKRPVLHALSRNGPRATHAITKGPRAARHLGKAGVMHEGDGRCMSIPGNLNRDTLQGAAWGITSKESVIQIMMRACTSTEEHAIIIVVR